MHARLLMVVALLVATALSGCTEDDGSYVPDENVNVVTDPADAAYIPNDTQEHYHDYWNGQDRIQIMDVADRSFSFTLGGGSSSCTTIYPEEGFFVPQGTAQVDFVASYTPSDTNMIGGMELRVKTAAMTDPEYVADINTDATDIVLETTLEDADLPHQYLSAWEVQFCAVGKPLVDFRSVSVTIDLTAEAVNGLEIPLFPPHPDFWDNGSITERTLLSEASGETLLWLGSGCMYCSGGLYRVDMDEGAIVPPDATEVIVTMDYSWNSPEGVSLMYHGADSRSFIDAPLEDDDGSTRTYVIPVDGDADGPYAEQSLWQFYFRMEGGEGDGPYNGEWTLSATVVKED